MRPIIPASSVSDQLRLFQGELDTKIIGVLATASVIISVASALAAEITLDGRVIPFAIAGLCFFVLLVKSVWVLHTRLFITTDDPTVLREDWWGLDPDEVKDKYWKCVEDAFKQNLRWVAMKGKALQWVVPLLAVEVVSLVVWLLLIPRS